MKKTVSGHTALYAILGDPIAHAMSPVLMNSNFEQLGMDKVFLALKANLTDFHEIFPVLVKLGFEGFVFTMPVKEVAVSYMDELTQEAKIIGAINCAVRKDGKLIGSNTDSIGFWKAIQQANDAEKPIRKAFVLGCGGFSKAAIAQAAIQGVQEIVVANRFEETSFMESFHKFQTRLLAHIPTVRITLVDWIPETWKSILPTCDLVANGTPNGMADKGDLHQIFPFDSVSSDTIFFDAVYLPRETRFLKMARSRGHIGVEGLDLLVHQGAVSFWNYTEKEASPSVMKENILRFWNEQ
ncbi:MAG: shikimate dehydrogenase [Spirochaetales bacterium]|jgi:shikimate dehydrogenase|nr:shikimate dehydrogenase [Spirochaetales bacterium]